MRRTVRRFRPSVPTWRRVVALASTGLVASTVLSLVSGPAAAQTPNVLDRPAAGVTADALPTTQIDGVAWDQAIVGSTVYVAGQFANARPAGAAAGSQQTSRNNMLSYDLATGVLTGGFNPNLNAQAKTVAPSPDGKRVYVGGNFTAAGGVSRYRIAAFDTASGALVTTFNAAVDFTANAIVATDTTVYVGGAFSKSGSTARGRLAAFSAGNGALLSWAPNADATVNALALTPDRASLIVGGAFQNINGAPAYGLAKVSAATGTLQPWAAGNIVRNAGANSAITSLTTDGSAIYGTGYHYGAGGNLEGTFSADPVSGVVKWVEDCHGDTYDAWAGNGAVYTVSHAHYCGNLGGFPQSEPWSINMRRALAFTSDSRSTLGHDPHGYFDWYGTPAPALLNWFPDLAAGTVTGKTQAAWTVTGNDRYVVMGGEFPTVNGTRQQGLVRFAVKGTAPGKVGPTYSGAQINPSAVPIASGVRVSWPANSDRDNKTLTYTLTRDGNQVFQGTADSTFWDRPTMMFIDSGVAAGSTVKYRVRVADRDGNTVQSDPVTFTAGAAAGPARGYPARVLADGAIAYWPMNEPSGPAFIDNAGLADAAASGPVTRGVAGAISGDPATGFGNGVTAATTTGQSGPGTFTAQAWINTTSTTGGKILGFGNNRSGPSANYDRHLYLDTSGRVFFGVYPGAVATINSQPGFNDGRWHQVTASLGGDGMKLYIDGKPVAARPDVTSAQDYAGFWRIGGDSLDGWPNQPSGPALTGAIDEVAIYPTALTAGTVDAQWVAAGRGSAVPAAPKDAYGAAVFADNPSLYWRLGETSGSRAADSGPRGDNVGGYAGGVTLGAAGGVRGTTDTAATFDGRGGSVAATSSTPSPTNYSEEAWIRTTSTAGGTILGFGDQQTALSGNYDRQLVMTTDGRVRFGVWTGRPDAVTSPAPLNDGKWHHLVATQSSTSGMTLYVDGKPVGSNPQTGAQAYTGFWRVGGDNQWGPGNAFFAGTIDEAAVYGRVLSAAQVAAHYAAGYTAPVNQAPRADFALTAFDLTATLSAAGSSDPDGTVTAYAWDFGDGTRGSGRTASHTYTAAGTKVITLTVTDNAGSTATTSRQVDVTAPNQVPTAAFTVTVNGPSGSFDASASTDPDGRIVSYEWDFGDGTSGSGRTAAHSYTTTGPRTVTLTVTDNFGASSVTTRTVG